MRTMLLTVLILALSTPALAASGTPPDRSILWQSERAFARAVPDPFLRDWKQDTVYGYDVDDVDLELAIDFDTQSVAGAGILTVTVTEADLTELVVDLTDSLTVEAVTVDGFARPFTHSLEQVIITLASAPSLGTQLVIRIDYHGTPPQVGNKSMMFGDHDGVPLVYTLSTPFSTQDETVIPISHYWRPCKDVPNDKSTFTLTITVPDSMLACSNGVMTSNVDNLDGTRTLIWEHDYPVAPYLIVVGVTNYVTIEDIYVGAEGSAQIQHFVYPEIYDNAVGSLDTIGSMIGYLASVFGEYPFMGEKYGVFSTPPGPAVEEQTMTAIPASLLNGGHSYDWLELHELAHQWWGDCVTCESWAEVWLNEGFASYSEALWEYHIGGQGAYRFYMLGMDNGPWSTAVYDPPYVWHSVVYDKGAWILHMLRWVMGDDDFFQFLLDYRAAFEYENATTAGLIAVAESVYGDDLNWFFDPWIYEVGRPDYEYSWSYTGSGPYNVHLRIDQVQSDTYPTYKMPIKVRVDTASRSEGFVVWDSLGTQTFDLVVSSEPTGVVMDPKDKILADFTENPTAVADRPIDRSGTFLAQNEPNPFNPSTTIRLGLSRAQTVALRVFDVQGRMVRMLRRGRLPAGEHFVVWDGRNDRGSAVASGVYYCQLVSADGVYRTKMILMK